MTAPYTREEWEAIKAALAAERVRRKDSPFSMADQSEVAQSVLRGLRG